MPALPEPVFPTPGLKTIAIDPGHGGEDAGVKGANGAIEKDVTLAIARRVKGAIEARLGLRVLLTRDDDRNVPIDERTAIANNNKADLFISLHANASLRKATSGATIFTAAFERVRRGRRRRPPAARTLPTFGGGARDIDCALGDGQARHLDRSATFAGMLEEQMRERVPVAAQALDRRRARVLVGEHAGGPVEVGYLTNPSRKHRSRPTRSRTPIAQRGLRSGRPVPRRLSAGGTLSQPERRMGHRRACSSLRIALRARWSRPSCGRRGGAAPTTSRPPATAAPPPAAPAEPDAEIKARLFYVADDGTQLKPASSAMCVRRRRRGAGARGSSRRRSRRRPSRWCPRCRPARRCKRVFITEGGEAYVDLSREVARDHPGGSIDEILTVYTCQRADR